MDRERLVKLMLMTTSDSDGEALNALRMANKMMAEHDIRWPDLLQDQRKVTVTVSREAPWPPSWQGAPSSYKTDEEWVAPHLKDPAVINLMFNSIYRTPMTDEFREFVDSVHSRWTKYGSLTQGQYNAIRKCYTKRRPGR